MAIIRLKRDNDRYLTSETDNIESCNWGIKRHAEIFREDYAKSLAEDLTEIGIGAEVA